MAETRSKVPTVPICPPNLIHVEDSSPGYSRKRWGKGFRYFDWEGAALGDRSHISRIKALVIPPNWADVWICQLPNGHLQATGYDDRKRKQYRYHDEWSSHRQLSKFAGLAGFGRKLPRIREQVRKDLRKADWPREKVLALVVSLIDAHHLRVGNRAYTAANETYGATTLRRRHLMQEDGQLALQYKAKSGKYRSIQIADRRLKKLLETVSELPGYELFRWFDKESGRHRVVDSQDINEYIHDISGGDFTAKTFRTWGGTVEAVRQFSRAQQLLFEHPQRKFETQLVRLVADELGNTVTVCREYYIHPGILEWLVTHQDDDAVSRKLKAAGHDGSSDCLDQFETLTLERLE